MQKNPCNVNRIPVIKTGFPVRKRDCQINENLKLQFFLFPRKKIDFFFKRKNENVGTGKFCFYFREWVGSAPIETLLKTFFRNNIPNYTKYSWCEKAKKILILPKKIQMEFKILVHRACFTQEPDLQR